MNRPYAMTLLAVAAGPAGTRERMGQLVGQITAVHAAVAEHNAAAAGHRDCGARDRCCYSGAGRIGTRGCADQGTDAAQRREWRAMRAAMTR